MDDLFDEESNEDERSGDPAWDSLKPSERKTLLDEVFQDDDWYDGSPFYVGGAANPAFDEIATRIGAPAKTIKKYYAAWLSARGLDAKSAFTIPGSIISASGPDMSEGRRNSPSQHIEDMMRAPVQLPSPPIAPPSGGDSTSNSVFAMMNFMAQQQALAQVAQAALPLAFQSYGQERGRQLAVASQAPTLVQTGQQLEALQRQQQLAPAQALQQYASFATPIASGFPTTVGQAQTQANSLKM